MQHENDARLLCGLCSKGSLTFFSEFLALEIARDDQQTAAAARTVDCVIPDVAAEYLFRLRRVKCLGTIDYTCCGGQRGRASHLLRYSCALPAYHARRGD